MWSVMDKEAWVGLLPLLLATAVSKEKTGNLTHICFHGSLSPPPPPVSKKECISEVSSGGNRLPLWLNQLLMIYSRRWAESLPVFPWVFISMLPTRLTLGPTLGLRRSLLWDQSSLESLKVELNNPWKVLCCRGAATHCLLCLSAMWGSLGNMLQVLRLRILFNIFLNVPAGQMRFQILFHHKIHGCLPSHKHTVIS